MRPARAIISLLVSLLTRAAAVQRTPLPSFTQRELHGGADLVLDYSIGAGASFAYARCQRRNEPEQYTGLVHKQCRLDLETSWPDGTSLRRTCNVRLYRRWTDGLVDRQFQLARFGHEHLVLVWRETIASKRRRRRRYIPYPVRFAYRQDHLRVKLVNMGRCQYDEAPKMRRELELVSEQRERLYEPRICRTSGECGTAGNETEIFAEDERTIHNLNIVVNGDESFDVFYRNAHLCGRERRCKVTYDAKKQKFSSVSVAPLQLKYDATLEINPIFSARDEILAYAVRSLHLDDGALTLLDPDGRPIYEHTYSWSPYNLPKGISHMAVSTVAEYLGFCQQPTGEPVIQCSLLDTRGAGRIGVDVALKSPDVAVIEMRNTRDSGFLLLIGYGNSTTNNGLEAMDILRVDWRGELANVYSARNHTCSRDRSGVDVGLFVNGTEAVCYYMVCTYPMPKLNVDETNWQVFGECFNEGED